MYNSLARRYGVRNCMSKFISGVASNDCGRTEVPRLRCFREFLLHFSKIVSDRYDDPPGAQCERITVIRNIRSSDGSE